MKLIKLVAIIVAVIVVALLAAPLWGGCGVKEDLCSSWCELRHFNSDMERLTCKASCAADKLSCMTK